MVQRNLGMAVGASLLWLADSLLQTALAGVLEEWTQVWGRGVLFLVLLASGGYLLYHHTLPASPPLPSNPSPVTECTECIRRPSLCLDIPAANQPVNRQDSLGDFHTPPPYDTPLPTEDNSLGVSQPRKYPATPYPATPYPATPYPATPYSKTEYSLPVCEPPSPDSPDTITLTPSSPDMEMTLYLTGLETGFTDSPSSCSVLSDSIQDVSNIS